MSAFEQVKQMSREELLDKIAALNLQEYGLCKGTLSEKIEAALTECREDGLQPGAAAALNNADTDGVLLSVLKDDPEKVMEGIAVAALALGTDKKILFIPESEQEYAQSEPVQAAAEKYQVEVRAEFVNKRACKGYLLMHMITAAGLVEALEGTYEPGIYVSVNGAQLQKVPYGTKLTEIAELDGAKAVRAGYRYLLPEAADIAVEDAEIDNGVLQVLTDKNCVVAETEKQLTASRKLSCGKCVFCREGLLQLQYMQKEITEGRGKADFPDLTREIGDAMKFSTLCTMGQVSADIALTAVNQFPSEYEAHIKKKACPAGVCFSSETVYIDPKLCNGCGDCMDACPQDCIEGKANYIHMIDDMACDKCGKCMEVCEADAIVRTSGKVPKLPNRLTKVGRFKKR